MSAPFFSVIIPTHNRPDDLANALKSLCNQNYDNFEAIVINDGQDDITEVVEQCGLTRIQVIKTEGGTGPSSARNAGLKVASGDVVAYLDDDDIFHPNHLETHAEQYKVSGVSVVYSDAQCTTITHDGNGKKAIETEVVHSRAFDADALMISNYIPIICLSHRREHLDKTGFFEPDLWYLEDWDLFIRLSQHHDFTHIPKTTATYFEKNLGTSIQEKHQDRFVDSLNTVYNRSHKQLSDEPERQSRITDMRLRHLGRMVSDTGEHFEKKGDLEQAATSYAKAAEYAPKPEYYLSLARVCKKLGQRDKALIAMQMAQRCAELEQEDIE